MFHFQYISIGLILPDIDGARVDLIKRWTKVNNYKKDRIQFYREKMQSVRASHDDFFQLYFSVSLTRSLDRNSWCGFWVLLARFRFTFFVRQTTDICKITGPVSLIWSLSDFLSVLSKCLKHQFFGISTGARTDEFIMMPIMPSVCLQAVCYHRPQLVRLSSAASVT